MRSLGDLCTVHVRFADMGATWVPESPRESTLETGIVVYPQLRLAMEANQPRCPVVLSLRDQAQERVVNAAT